jgi:hypothetical protein
LEQHHSSGVETDTGGSGGDGATVPVAHAPHAALVPAWVPTNWHAPARVPPPFAQLAVLSSHHSI